MREITFTLGDPFPLLNKQMRKHYRTRQREKLATGRKIASLLGAERPSEPFRKAVVQIVRHSTGTPDRDGLYGGCKDLLDCLTTPRLNKQGETVNKYGLGLIVDDAPQFIDLSVTAERCKRAEQRTVVTIREVVG